MSLGHHKVSVEDAKPADCASIRQLALDAYIDAWSEADYLEEIGRTGSFVLKANVNETLAGFLVARIVPGNGTFPDAEIYNIAVISFHKRRGIGSSLLASLLDKLKIREVRSVWLEVRESNFEAISFYERHGFTAQVTRHNFYSNPTESAVIMRLQTQPHARVSEA